MPPTGFETTISAGELAVDLHLRPRGHWDRHVTIYHIYYVASVLCGHAHLFHYVVVVVVVVVAAAAVVAY